MTTYPNLTKKILLPFPKTCAEAISPPHCQQAIDSELRALEANKTWILTTLPPGKQAIGCKWVIKVKNHIDSSIEKHKAWSGSQRVYSNWRTSLPRNLKSSGEDYSNQSFAGSCICERLVSGTIICQYYLLSCWSTIGSIHEASPRLGKLLQSEVSKLAKSLYGLKQYSCRQWNAKLTSVLLDSGYKQSIADFSLFTKSCSCWSNGF